MRVGKCKPYIRSHPTWVRGLKPFNASAAILIASSHPTWVRGLKPDGHPDLIPVVNVAPHVGAWIETGRVGGRHVVDFVAPHVGAWIETLRGDRSRQCSPVAPHVGAWIETGNATATGTSISGSHPTWVRGLKRVVLGADQGGLGRNPRGCLD